MLNRLLGALIIWTLLRHDLPLGVDEKEIVKLVADLIWGNNILRVGTLLILATVATEIQVLPLIRKVAVLREGLWFEMIHGRFIWQVEVAVGTMTRGIDA